MQRPFDKHRIIVSTTPYPMFYARVAFGIQNTPERIEKTLAAIRSMNV